MKSPQEKQTAVEKIVTWIGSTGSILFHSVIFLILFLLTIAGPFPRDTVLLVWNTCVSLEAIYLAIFIQFTVNKNTMSLREVEEDIDEIQEDVEELGEDVEDIQEDIEEISEDIEEMSEEEEQKAKAQEEATMRAEHKDQGEMLEKLTNDVRSILTELEALKKSK